MTEPRWLTAVDAGRWWSRFHEWTRYDRSWRPGDWDAIVGCVIDRGYTEADIKTIARAVDRDVYRVRLWNGTRLNVSGMEAVAARRRRAKVA